MLPKNSALTPVVLEAFKIMYKNGTYKAIMEKWGLGRNMAAHPGKNMGIDVK